MNNKLRIVALELKILKAQAEIKELESRQGKRFKPELNGTYFKALGTGKVSGFKYRNDEVDLEYYNNFNYYETKALATKAARDMKRNNAIIMACLMVDPDFVPDYLSGNQKHYSFQCQNGEMSVHPRWVMTKAYACNYGPSVSTREKWEEAAALLKEWGIE